MKSKVTCLLITLCLFSFSVLAQGKASPEAEAFFSKAMSQINPKHVAWVKSTAKTTEAQNANEAAIKKMATNYALLGSLNNQDIEALSFLVLMQASKSAQEDLKAIMANVKSINEQKQTMRDAMNRMNDKQQAVSKLQLDSFKLLLKPAQAVKPVANVKPIQTTKNIAPAPVRNTVVNQPASVAELNKTKDEMKNKLDSLSELGEEQQLKMQMVMDRMTKADSAASNLMKKFSETSSSIIQNLK
jgi:hypothetical protein